jgi:hypothetical protein
MQYLQSQPFTVGLGSRKFAEGWDRIFSRKQEAQADSEERSPDTERAPATVEGEDDHDLGEAQG